MITLQPRDQAPQFVISVGDFAVVKMVAILSVVRLGRIIRAVRIIEVKPEKKWAMSGLLQPVDRVSDAFRCFAIDQAQISFLEFLRGEGIVIEIKTASQSPTAVEHKRADHSPGRISMLFESLREGAELRSERLPGEILHAILKWIGSRENDRMRRPGERNLRDGVFKEDADVGEGIGRRSLHLLCAVATDVVGANSVDRDQNDIGRQFVRWWSGNSSRAKKVHAR